MREIGIIAREEDSRVLADFLLTRNITTKIEPRADAWVVWVHREDRLPEARTLLAEFTANPSDPRFLVAAKAAQEIRKLSEKVEREHQKRTRNLLDRWEGSMFQRAPLAFGLMVVSVIVFLIMSWDRDSYLWVLTHLSFSTKAIDEYGIVSDTGFDAILKGQVWRLITPIFIHFGIFHILLNMMAMRFLGERVEMRKGTWRFAILVFVSAITSNVGESLMRHEGTFGGMSGVIFAIAGYLWIKGHTDPEDHLSLDERNVRWMLSWFLMGIVGPMVLNDAMIAQLPPQIGYLFHMANIAHGVGLATGVIFGLLRF